MNTIKEIITSKYGNTVNNGNKNNSNNGINGNNDTRKSKYALDRSMFTPNTEESVLAEEIAMRFNDLDNFACYFSVVKRLGCPRTRMIFQQALGEITEKKDTKRPVRSPARYFMWKVKTGY